MRSRQLLTKATPPSKHSARFTDEPVLDLRFLVERVARWRWWVIASIVLSSALFSTAAFVMTPIYRASALLMPANSERGVNGAINSALGQVAALAAVTGIGSAPSDADTEEALAVLRSREFTEGFIADLNLMPQLFPKQWDAAGKRWKPSPSGPPTLYKAFKRFGRVRTVIEDKKTGLITVQIDWRDRNVAAVWANALADRVNAEMRERAIAQADASLRYLENQLRTTSTVETRVAIDNLIEAQVNQRMLANVTPEFAFKVVDRAMPVDSDDPIKPRKTFLIVLGPLLGAALGILGTFFFELSAVGEVKIDGTLERNAE